MSWLDSARRIVEQHQYEVLDPETGDPVPTEWVESEEGGDTLAAVDGKGILLDAFSASIMVQIHDGLSEENRAKYAAMPLPRAHNVAMNILAKKGG